jgi:preprotein translocase subunit SecD
MRRRLYWRVITIVVVLAAAAGLLARYRLPLGLDLKGGVQLVVRVDTGYAVRLEAQQRTLTPGGEASVREDAVVRTIETVERRINELGVSEPSIARQGAAGDELLIQLPGMTEVDRAKAIIQAGGTLEFKLADADKPPVITGRDLRSARASLDENNQPAVTFTLTTEGGSKFGAFTAANIGRSLAILVDGRVRSVGRIENRITTEGIIHGSFTPQEAQDLALVLRSGSLPAPLTFLAEGSVSASLGADSIRRGVTASIVGLLLVAGFMLTYYRASGVNAIVALVCNLLILLGLMAYVGVVMTLPGIAGFVLTMGIGVDSNVLVFERIREEREGGKSDRASINAGFGRVFLTLLDTHIAALISAAFLFQFGTGPIRGFAVTLSIGLLSNLFTSTFVSKTLFELTFQNASSLGRGGVSVHSRPL